VPDNLANSLLDSDMAHNFCYLIEASPQREQRRRAGERNPRFLFDAKRLKGTPEISLPSPPEYETTHTTTPSKKETVFKEADM
jgi:hypothetical protein